MSNQIVSKSAEASNINQFDIAANGGGESVSIAGGIIKFEYFESILEDTITARVTFADTGNTINNKTALDGLPIVGSEKVSIKFTDNNDKEIKLSLYIKKATPIYDDTTKSMVILDLVSKEMIMNEKVRLNQRFDGKISDYIKTIFTDKKYLGSEKNFEIEEVSNNYNFIGNNWKPFYAANWLSKRSVSAKNQTLGDSAGYLFFETSDGFKFKSIDGLFAQKQKKSIIYNQTPDLKVENVPAGYDIKALEYEKDNRVDVQSKFQMGTYSTRTIVFDPFNCYYEVINPISEEKKSSLKLGGKELPVLNPEFNRPGKNKDFSRTQYMLIDKGTIPTGDTQQQIAKSGEPNFDPQKILNQATMRYNQLFSSTCTVKIAGDYSLHAGDIVFLDAPDLQTNTKNDEINKQSGGKYLIADLCHYVTPRETYTALTLARDSVGRKGNHTSR